MGKVQSYQVFCHVSKRLKTLLDYVLTAYETAEKTTTVTTEVVTPASITLTYLFSSRIDAWMFRETALPYWALKWLASTFEVEYSDTKEDREVVEVDHLEVFLWRQVRLVNLLNWVDRDHKNYGLVLGHIHNLLPNIRTTSENSET